MVAAIEPSNQPTLPNLIGLYDNTQKFAAAASQMFFFSNILCNVMFSQASFRLSFFLCHSVYSKSYNKTAS